MPVIEERDGVLWQLAYGKGCADCHGSGAFYEHRPSCSSDFCEGTGDEYDCGGHWNPCSSCGSMQRRVPVGQTTLFLEDC